MIKRKLLLVFCLSLFLGAAPAMASIFFDDFDSEIPGTPATSLTNWDVMAGTVDVIGAGTAFDFFPLSTHGLYLDMDGTSDPMSTGTIQTKTSLDLLAGSYTLSFDLAGNQRDDVFDAVIVHVSLGALDRLYILPRLAPFTTFTEEFTVAGGSYDLVFGGWAVTDGDNVGMLLDNVGVAVVPVPGAVLLGLLGLSAVGIKLRKFA